MRNFPVTASIIARVIALAAALVVALPQAAALAGGPTSVILVNHEGARAAAAVTGSPAYDALARSLDAFNPPTGTENGPAQFMDQPIRLTWLIHDVTAWRVDGIAIRPDGVWVSTAMTVDGSTLFDQPAVWHQPADPDLLLTTLTTLGILDRGSIAASRPAATSPEPDTTSDSALADPKVDTTSGSALADSRVGTQATGSGADSAAGSGTDSAADLAAEAGPDSGVPAPAFVAGLVLTLLGGAALGSSTRRRREAATTPVPLRATSSVSSSITPPPADATSTMGPRPAAYDPGRETLKRFTLR